LPVKFQNENGDWVKNCSTRGGCPCSNPQYLGEFYPHPSTGDKLATSCRTCQRVMRKKRQLAVTGTMADFKSTRWNAMNVRAINGRYYRSSRAPGDAYAKNGVRLEMTRGDFCSWCEENKEIIMEMFAKGETPSIDRISPLGNYELSNIRVVTSSENSRLACKRVRATFPDGSTKDYAGQVQMARALKIAPTTISMTLNGHRTLPSGIKVEWIS